MKTTLTIRSDPTDPKSAFMEVSFDTQMPSGLVEAEATITVRLDKPPPREARTLVVSVPLLELLEVARSMVGYLDSLPIAVVDSKKHLSGE